MRLTETEKETLRFLLNELLDSSFDWDDSVNLYIDMEGKHDPGLLKRRLKRLAKKGILESVRDDKILGLNLTCTRKKLLLAYNGIFIDTLEDHLSETYGLDIYLIG